MTDGLLSCLKIILGLVLRTWTSLNFLIIMFLDCSFREISNLSNFKAEKRKKKERDVFLMQVCAITSVFISG